MKNTGIIFDIQRFSLHDGPGIRTTVFMKGCPLRCIWCHNPESWNIRPQLMFLEEKCVHCLECVNSCRNRVHQNKTGRHIVNHTACHGEGVCESHCVYGALKLSGKSMNVETVLAEVLADTVFYRNSGGGLTISGGEPMLQYDFLKSLLEKAKNEHIHTCLETSGFSEWEKFEQIHNMVDIFMYDIKHISDREHRKLTGVSNEQILTNLDRLYKKGANIVLRCPIIPGINDTDEHIEGIALLSREYPKLLGVELLPYHDMGKGKWEQIGKEYTLPDLKIIADEAQKVILERFLKAGCRNVSLQ